MRQVQCTTASRLLHDIPALKATRALLVTLLLKWIVSLAQCSIAFEKVAGAVSLHDGRLGVSAYSASISAESC